MIKLKKKILDNQVKNRGAVLLIAILVSSVALAVGLGVYNRTYKELLFASFWKQTQIAFSAADSGLECAIYWDTQSPRPTTASCFGSNIVGWDPSQNASANFSASISGGCVNIIITKSASVPVITTIEARGYNTCDASNPRRVERGLGVQY